MPSRDPHTRVQDILRSIEFIDAYVAQAGGVTQLLRTEGALKDAVERRLLIISEAAVKLAALAEALQPDTPWRISAGLEMRCVTTMTAFATTSSIMS